MSNDKKETLLGDGQREPEDNFEALRGSLGRIRGAMEKKRKLGGKFHAGVIQGDTRSKWRKDLAEALESTAAHVFLVSLLLIDLVATVVDILKTIHNKTHDLDSCTSLLEGCYCVEEFERSESWEFIYWISIVILSILAINVVLLLLGFGLYFFKHPGYILDAFVVITALCLEIFLDSETVGLLIILTLWRIVRVAHGIFEVTDEAWEEEIHQFEKRLADLESKHDDDQKSLNDKDSRITQLERNLGGMHKGDL